jgi:hypothetical protein
LSMLTSLLLGIFTPFGQKSSFSWNTMLWSEYIARFYSIFLIFVAKIITLTPGSSSLIFLWICCRPTWPAPARSSTSPGTIQGCQIFLGQYTKTGKLCIPNYNKITKWP